MKIQFLGAHNIESQNSKFVTMLIDDVLAIDAGGLTEGLSLWAQLRLKAVLLTHQHYDHVRDIPALAMNFFIHDRRVQLYGLSTVREVIEESLLNGKLYPNFFQRPPENPAIVYNPVEPNQVFHLDGYNVLPVQVKHPVPTVGYQVTVADGKSIFYTSDTGPGLSECWQHVSPKLLIAELTVPDRMKEQALSAGHLTPSLLKEELLSFQKMKAYLPSVILVHMNPRYEEEISTEVGLVAGTLCCSIKLAYEGLQVNL